MTDKHCYLLGEHTIVFTLTTQSPARNAQRRLFALTAKLLQSDAFFEVVPAKASVTVYLKNPQDHPLWIAKINALWDECEVTSYTPTTHTLTVKYGRNFGPDLTALANTLQITEKQIVELHSSILYQVEFIGFLPGFAYLGTLPKALQLPRKETPRTHVPKGSVAIAQELTAVYPSASPGGWHLVGQCDTPLFDPLRAQPSVLMPGDQVKFMPSKEGLC